MSTFRTTRVWQTGRQLGRILAGAAAALVAVVLLAPSAANAQCTANIVKQAFEGSDPTDIEVAPGSSVGLEFTVERTCGASGDQAEPVRVWETMGDELTLGAVVGYPVQAGDDPGEITAVLGNAACQLAGAAAGVACDPFEPSQCVLPCFLGANEDGVVDDDTTFLATPGRGFTGLQLPSNPNGIGEPRIVLRPDAALTVTQQCPAIVPPNLESLIEDRATVIDSSACLLTSGGCSVNERIDFDDATLVCKGVPPPPPVPDFQCYPIKPEPRTRFQHRTIEITDQFGTRSARIARPFELCAPVSKEGEGIQDPEAHLTCYKLVTRQRDPWRLLGDIDQFTPGSDGTFFPENLIVGRGAELCFPAVKDCVDDDDRSCDVALEDLQQRLSHFQCYQARSLAEDPFVPGVLTLEDQFGLADSFVGSAIKHCNPLTAKAVDGGGLEELSVATFPEPEPGATAFWEGGEDVHLKCYDVDSELRPNRTSVEIRDQLHPDGYRVRVGRPLQLCEPAVKVLPEELDD